MTRATRCSAVKSGVMPVIQFKGRTAVESYHRVVPHHTLEVDAELSETKKPALDGNLIIDDNEVHHLRMLMNEIFGEENFIAQIVWKKRSTPPNDKIIGANHEYILCFARDANLVALNLRERSEEQRARYTNPDNHPKGP